MLCTHKTASSASLVLEICPKFNNSYLNQFSSISGGNCINDTPISPSACPSPADCLTATTTRPPVRPSFPTIHHTHDSNHSLAVVNEEQDSHHSLAVVNGEQSHTIHRTQDSSQSLAVVNGEQSRKAKIFHRAFTNYNLLLRALGTSSIYLCDFRRVAPPKSGEDAHVTRGTCDFGGATLNNPSLGCSYVLPRLWDPGGVSSSDNTPRDLSRTIAPSRYPNALLTGYLINLPSQRRWQDLRTSHVKLENFFTGILLVALPLTRFYQCLGYVLVVLNLSVPKIIIS